MIADDLATQADAGEALRRQHVTLGDRNAVGLARQELDSARGAARVAAAGMQLVDAGFLGQGQHEPLAGGHLELSHSVDG